MQKLTNEQKASLYNQYLFQYQRIQEKIREIKTRNFEQTEGEMREIQILEIEAKKIYSLTERLYR